MSSATSRTAQVIKARETWVARGITESSMVVGGANGSEVWDLEGRRYIDFASGIGSLNLGHGHDHVVEAIHAQVDRYMHQCVIVGLYEPYVDMCRRLAELAPISGPVKS